MASSAARSPGRAERMTFMTTMEHELEVARGPLAADETELDFAEAG